MSDLPGGWVETTLGEIASLITKGTTPTTLGFQFQPSGIPFVKIENIKDWKINRSSIEQYISTECHETLKRSQLAEGDVLFSIAGTIGKTALVDKHSIPANTNQAVALIRGTSNVIMPRLLSLELAFLADDFASKNARGGAMNNISLGDVKSLVLSVPPLNEQKRIAEKLDSLLTRVDSCRSHLERVPQILKRFRQSILAAATSGRLTEDWREANVTGSFESDFLSEARKRSWETNEIRKRAMRGLASAKDSFNKYIEPVEPEDLNGFQKPDSWVFVSADQITFLITDGKHGDCKDEFNSGYYFLSVKDLYNGTLHYDGARQVREDDFLEVHYRTNLEVGDVLVTNAGTIGRVAVAKDADKVSHTTFQKSVAILKPVRDIVLPKYLAIYIESSVTHLVEKSSGTAVKNLLLRDLRRITIGLPSMSEQAEIVRRVEKLFAYAERLEARYWSAMERVEQLTPSLLAKAFRGDLVEQDPNDEPASVLLERIQKIGESNGVSSGKKKSADH